MSAPLSFREIAFRMQLSESRVRQIYRSALRKLQVSEFRHARRMAHEIDLYLNDQRSEMEKHDA